MWRHTWYLSYYKTTPWTDLPECERRSSNIILVYCYNIRQHLISIIQIMIAWLTTIKFSYFNLHWFLFIPTLILPFQSTLPFSSTFTIVGFSKFVWSLITSSHCKSLYYYKWYLTDKRTLAVILTTYQIPFFVTL